MDLVSEVRQLDRRIAKAAGDIQTAVTASATTLTNVHGLGGHCQLEQSEGDFRRFASAIHQVACDV
jgi:transposase